MGLRQDRISDQIRDVLAHCFVDGGMRDPRLQGVTITAVKITADLQLASIYYRLYPGNSSNDVQQALERAEGFLRRKLAGELDVRRIPSLRFFFDESVERGARIEQLLETL